MKKSSEQQWEWNWRVKHLQIKNVEEQEWMTDEGRKQFQFFIVTLEKDKDCLIPLITHF